MVENNWTDIEEVQKQIALAAQMVGRRSMNQFTESAYGILPSKRLVPVESPLEAIFYVWWSGYLAGASGHTQGDRFRLDMQQDVTSSGQNYRLDFVVGLESQAAAARFADVGCPFQKIAIEVDGHGFHEKTPEQVARRNQRDRSLQQDGWIVFHFSWTEMTTKGEACVGEVLDHAITALFQCDRADASAWMASVDPEEMKRIIDALPSSGKDLAD